MQGFEDLKGRAIGDKTIPFKDALIITATTVPGHLQCEVRRGLLNEPACIHWDNEGRSACESCIRAALSKDFHCPITGVEISHDDIHINRSLQHAVDIFTDSVNRKMKEINENKATHDEGFVEQADKDIHRVQKNIKEYDEKGKEAPVAEDDSIFDGDIFYDDKIEKEEKELSGQDIYKAAIASVTNRRDRPHYF